MDWLKHYGPATCGLFASAWLAAYAGFNMGVSAKQDNANRDAAAITASASPAVNYGSPHSD